LLRQQQSPSFAILVSVTAAMKAIAQDELLTLGSAFIHLRLDPPRNYPQIKEFPALIPVLVGFPC
jgi:hypothetical protein